MKKFLVKFFRKLLFEHPSFKPLYLHAQKVYETVEALAEMIDEYTKGNEVDSEEVSSLEHEADIIKQEIRSKLPRSDLWLPVARSDLLDFLWHQDKIADNCQDAAGLLSLMRIKLPLEMKERLERLNEMMMRTIKEYKHMIEKLSEVLESSFGRSQVDEIWQLINKINVMEHEADIIEGELVRMTYTSGLNAFEKYHLIQITLKIGDVIDHMEDAGGRLRIMTAR